VPLAGERPPLAALGRDALDLPAPGADVLARRAQAVRGVTAWAIHNRTATWCGIVLRAEPSKAPHPEDPQ